MTYVYSVMVVSSASLSFSILHSHVWHQVAGLPLDVVLRLADGKHPSTRGIL